MFLFDLLVCVVWFRDWSWFLGSCRIVQLHDEAFVGRAEILVWLG